MINSIFVYIVAILVASFGGDFIIRPFVNRLKEYANTIKENEFGADYSKLVQYLGILERGMYITAWVMGYPEFIAFWLSFKVIGQWGDWTKTGQSSRAKFIIFLIGSAVSLSLSIGVALLATYLLDNNFTLNNFIPELTGFNLVTTDFLTFIGVIFALAGNIQVSNLWNKDRNAETEFYRSIRDKLLMEELNRNLAIVNETLEKIAKGDIGNPRFFERQVFDALLGSQVIARFLSRKATSRLFECYNSVASMNNLIHSGSLIGNYNWILSQTDSKGQILPRKYCAEIKGDVEYLISEIEKERV